MKTKHILLIGGAGLVAILLLRSPTPASPTGGGVEGPKSLSDALKQLGKGAASGALGKLGEWLS